MDLNLLLNKKKKTEIIYFGPVIPARAKVFDLRKSKNDHLEEELDVFIKKQLQIVTNRNPVQDRHEMLKKKLNAIPEAV